VGRPGAGAGQHLRRHRGSSSSRRRRRQQQEAAAGLGGCVRLASSQRGSTTAGMAGCVQQQQVVADACSSLEPALGTSCSGLAGM
jgi:hypothetical protein